MPPVPNTMVFLFDVRYPDEPNEKATHCRHIVIPGNVAQGGDQFDQQLYQIEQTDVTGKPHWVAYGDAPPNALMADLFLRVCAGAAGQARPREDGPVRTVDLGTIVVPRVKR